MTSATPCAVVIGSGVVGTATGLGLASRGVRVAFCDTSPARRDVLAAMGLEVWTTDDLRGHRPGAYLLSVPTPTRDGRVDLSYLADATAEVGAALRERSSWACVVVRSTVPPGTTGRLVVGLLEEHSGKRAGVDFGVAMNPEFLRAATAAEDFMTPRVIVIGAIDERSDAAVRRLYEPWSDVPTVSMDLCTAEATKYTANLFNATKISFFNEMHRVLGGLGADPDLAFRTAAAGAEGLWNPAYGIRGGAPYGGVCLPKDTVAFASFASERGEQMPLLQATIAVNEQLEIEAASCGRRDAPAVVAAGELPL